MLHLPEGNRAEIFRRLLHLSQQLTLPFLTVLVGLLTGIGVLLFRAGVRLITQVSEALFTTPLAQQMSAAGINPHLLLIGWLIIMGVLVGWIVQHFIGKETYGGIAGIIAATALAGGRLPYIKIPFKVLASILSIGAGASVGANDPGVQIGSYLGSFIGYKLHLSEEHVRLLVGAGAASAVASAFNAPIAGVFFALEVVLGEFTTRSFGMVVLASVISGAITQEIRGVRPVFEGVNQFVAGGVAELPLYALLGILLGILSSVILRYYFWQTTYLRDRVNLPLPLKTGLAGAAVGIMGLFFPDVLGGGERFMQSLLVSENSPAILILLLLIPGKLLATAISQGGGFQGGLFFPALFMGIVSGRAYGEIISRIFPVELVGEPQSYAVAGMAGLMAGVIRAPITAIILVFELTDDYALILPMMLTSVACTIFIESIGPDGIYTLSLLQHGIRLQRGRDIDVMQGVEVREAMHPPALIIPESASLLQLRDAFRAEKNSRAICVVDKHGHLTGIVTLGDLQRAYEAATRDDHNTDTLTVGDICKREVIKTYPDDVLWTAIQTMGQHHIGQLPVVEHGGQRPLALLSWRDVMDAYTLAITRKAQDEHYAERIRLGSLTGAHVVEYYVRDGVPVCGKSIRTAQLPSEVVVASIRRGGKLIVPHGDTEIRSGDTLTLVADPHEMMILDELFGEHGTDKSSIPHRD
ncbi:MAG: chloride channel protein [Aggregatilineales bacterium]